MSVIRNYLLQIFPYVLLLVLLLSSIFYFLKLTFTDGRTTRPNTFESWLMIPDELKDKYLSDMGSIESYSYSAGEAAKPITSTAFILVKGEKADIERKLKKYCLLKEFKIDAKYHSHCIKGDKEMGYILERVDRNIWEVRLTVLEYF